MNEHAGPACALSGLIVGIFAVLLHDRNPPPPVPPSPARGVSSASPRGGAPSSPDTPAAIRPAPPREVAASPAPAEGASVARPTVALREIRVENPPTPGSPPPGPPPEAKARPRPSRPEPPVEPPKKPTPPFPRSSFAIVEPGESLADVAARVYGSKEAAEALWKANRDQVERVDSPLARGTLLRTP
jgi:hypothetical protein